MASSKIFHKWCPGICLHVRLGYQQYLYMNPMSIKLLSLSHHAIHINEEYASRNSSLYFNCCSSSELAV